MKERMKSGDGSRGRVGDKNVPFRTDCAVAAAGAESYSGRIGSRCKETEMALKRVSLDRLETGARLVSREILWATQKRLQSQSRSHG